MALKGRPWNDCKGDEKKKLRITFDTLKSEAIDEGRGAFEQVMDQIGVRTKNAKEKGPAECQPLQNSIC